MTLDDAWDITQEFAAFLAEGKTPAQYEFEDVLPYKKSDILLAIIFQLVHLKKEDIDPTSGTLEEIKTSLSALVMYLESFIPSEETYQAMLNVKSLIDEKFGKKGQ